MYTISNLDCNIIILLMQWNDDQDQDLDTILLFLLPNLTQIVNNSKNLNIYPFLSKLPALSRIFFTKYDCKDKLNMHMTRNYKTGSDIDNRNDICGRQLTKQVLFNENSTGCLRPHCINLVSGWLD